MPRLAYFVLAMTALLSSVALAQDGDPVPGPRGHMANVIAPDSMIGPGSLDPEMVVRLIRVRRRAFEFCYERGLATEPGTAVRVAVAFRIEANGDVAGVTARADADTFSATAGCITRVLRGFHFEPGAEGGPATLAFTFAFEPG